MPHRDDATDNASEDSRKNPQDNLWQSLHWSVRWLIGIAATLIAEFLLSRAWNLIPSPWGLLKTTLAYTWTPWTLVGILLLVVLFLCAGISVSRKVMKETRDEVVQTLDAMEGAIDAKNEHIDTLQAMLDVALNSVRLQADVLWSLDNLLSDNVPLACKNMVKMILAQNAHLLNTLIFRCYVLRPCGDYLTTYIAQQMPEPDGYERTFYIGDNPNILRGVAGYAYKNVSIEIARRIESDDPAEGVKFDHPQFITLDSTVPAPQYRSVICVPIKPEPDRCIGVLCLDSEDPTAFDDEIQQQ